MKVKDKERDCGRGQKGGKRLRERGRVAREGTGQGQIPANKAL